MATLIVVSGNMTKPSAFKVKSAMQLYSRDRGVSQPIEGHPPAFARSASKAIKSRLSYLRSPCALRLAPRFVSKCLNF
jgi:hypothetical protein